MSAALQLSKMKIFVVVLIFGILSVLDFGVFIFSAPTLSELNVSEGIVFVSKPKKNGRQFNLKVNANLIEFECRLNTRANRACLSNQSLNGQQAKVWWYDHFVFGPIKQKILFQLEINGQNVLSYEKQKRKYLEQKADYPYLAFLLFVISILFFLVKLFKVAKK